MNLVTQLVDDRVDRNVVVICVGFQLGVEPVADCRDRAATVVGDDHSVGPDRQKVLQRDLELVNERHGPPSLGGYSILDKICYHARRGWSFPECKVVAAAGISALRSWVLLRRIAAGSSVNFIPQPTA